MSEVKEFWEWCGAEYLEKLGGFRFPDSSFYRLSQLTDFTDPIVLGLLFKWAVPRTIKLLQDTRIWTQDLAMAHLFTEWLSIYWKPRQEPISIDDALYEAIQKVRKECQK